MRGVLLCRVLEHPCLWKQQMLALPKLFTEEWHFVKNWNCESVQSQKSWGKPCIWQWSLRKGNVLAVESQQADMLW